MSEQLAPQMPATPARSRRSILLGFIGAGVFALIAANVHLVYVAMKSQPDCVTHLKDAGVDGSYRAARSSC